MSESPDGKLIIESFLCSADFGENCLLVYQAVEGADCWIVEPGFGQGGVIGRIEELGLKPAAIVLTHGHVDHIAGIPELKQRWAELPIWIGQGEAGSLSSSAENLSADFGLPMALDVEPDRLLNEGERIALGEFEWQVLDTDGHSPGGISLYCEQAGEAIVGDAVFAGSIGRTDLPGGDMPRLLDNIRSKLLTLPGATRLWPGHGPTTTVEREARRNPFLQGA